MKCKSCRGTLEVLRQCRKICLQCKKCGQEYKVHEIADQLEPEMEEILEAYTCIIYD
jgi:DNA-directed RNA polymerase subunit M/transcription elongation factor TFIIS